MRLPPPVAPRTTVPVPPRVPSPSKLRMPLLLMLTVPLRTRPPVVTRWRLLASVAMSRLPTKVTPVSRLTAVLVTVNSPLPLVLMLPLRVTPCWRTVLPLPATI
ncbi:MAG: hypothetical protein AW07_01048 [Candidatus Accumulibacter sp. SK-11]|nr:MAG: hypothetical protein AW07_01048 [Candidatus Accumulibacter sp. SK-11]